MLARGHHPAEVSFQSRRSIADVPTWTGVE